LHSEISIVSTRKTGVSALSILEKLHPCHLIWLRSAGGQTHLVEWWQGRKSTNLLSERSPLHYFLQLEQMLEVA
jgi:hypothetical protein